MNIDEYYSALANGEEISEYDVDLETYEHIHKFDEEQCEAILDIVSNGPTI